MRTADSLRMLDHDTLVELAANQSEQLRRLEAKVGPLRFALWRRRAQVGALLGELDRPLDTLAAEALARCAEGKN